MQPEPIQEIPMEKVNAINTTFGEEYVEPVNTYQAPPQP